VGREDEFRALQEAVERLREGVGGIVTVVGEAGIGKSRLVAEARATAEVVREPPLRWIEGRCLSYAMNVAYQLWLDVLRGWLNVAPDAPPLTVRDTLREQVYLLCEDCFDQVYAYLGRMLSLPLENHIASRLHGLDGESLQFITFRAVETLLKRAAEQHPLVVVCEDLHWADTTSLALLERLLALPDRVPLLLLCVFRPERAHDCWRIKEMAARDYAHGHTDLQLETLSSSASEVLIGNLLHVTDLPQTLRMRILDHAEGNPLYVEEILRSLIDGRIIIHDASLGQWHTTQDVSDISIPDTLHGVIAARIDRLPEETKRILRLASVIGRIFTYSILSAIVSSPPVQGESGRGSLDSHLLALRRFQLIRQRQRVPEREYAFKHHLTQEAAYGTLLRRKRRAAHRRVAEALETLYPDRVEGQLGLLAYHWEQAGENEQAADYLRRAGEQAAAQYANKEAIGYLTRALDLTPLEDAAARYLILLARESVYDVQGARRAQSRDLKALTQAAKILAQCDDELGRCRRLAKVALREAVYNQRMRDTVAAGTAAQRAIQLAQMAQEPGIEAAAWLELSKHDGGELGTRETQLKKALSLARLACARPAEAECLRELGMAAQNCGDRAAAATYLEQALHIYRELGNRTGEARTIGPLCGLYSSQGDIAASISYAEQSLRLCRETGYRSQEAWAMVQLGVGFHQQGDHTRAKSCTEQGLRIWREIGDRSTEMLALLVLGWILDALGAYKQAEDCYEQGYAISLVRHQKLGSGQVLRSLLYHHLGEDKAAQQYAQQAIDFFERIGNAYGQIDAQTVLGHALAGLGDQTGAAKAYHQSLALCRELDQDHLIAEPLAGLGRVALAESKPTEAIAPVQEILEVLETRPKLEGTWEPLRVYLTCYRVLLTIEDARAAGILDTAYHLIRERADKIDDDELRRSYLENVAVHREIVKRWMDAQVDRSDLEQGRV
jgi:predicted ATPase